jgi:hypothetical protein
MRITLYGGSNSFMGGGYVYMLAEKLADRLDITAEIDNRAMGNTFVHYGLYEAIKSGSHQHADVVVIEYAVNDQELINHKKRDLWHCGYEGLVRRIRRENPRAHIISVILYPIRHYRALVDGHAWGLATLIDTITTHYGGTVVDTAAWIRERNDGELPATDDVFRDGAHYNSTYQAVVAEQLTDALASIGETAPGEDVRPPDCLSAHDFSLCRLTTSDMLERDSSGTQVLTFSNSRSSTEAVQIGPGSEIVLPPVDQLVCLIYAATEDDAYIMLDHDDGRLLISAYRRAYTDAATGRKWPFLMSNIVPGLAVSGGQFFHASGGVRLRVLTAKQIDADGPAPFFRGSTVEPPETDRPASFNLIDALYLPEVGGPP